MLSNGRFQPSTPSGHSHVTSHTLHKVAPTPEDMASKSARVAELERALSGMRSVLNSMRADQSHSEADARAMQSRLRELEVTSPHVFFFGLLGQPGRGRFLSQAPAPSPWLLCQKLNELLTRKDKTRVQENARLRRALVGLEEEVERLRKELGVRNEREARLKKEVSRRGKCYPPSLLLPSDTSIDHLLSDPTLEHVQQPSR